MKKIKKIVFLTGPSCVGKTTISTRLMNKIPNTYLVSYDKLKEQLQGYDREKHREVMRSLTLGYLDTVCKEGFFIFVELWPLSTEDLASVQKIASKHGYDIFSANLTAPDEIVLERSKLRIEKAVKENRENSIMDIEIYKNNLKTRVYLPKPTLQIDTSKTSINNCVNIILSHLSIN